MMMDHTRDAALVTLREAEKAVPQIIAYLTEARDGLAAAAPDERERAARHLAMAELRMRADAAVLARNLANLATPAGQ